MRALPKTACLLPMVLGLILTSACAFAEGEAPKKTVTLSVWQLARPEATGIQAKSDRAVTRAFEKWYEAKTGNRVRLVSPTGITIPEIGEMDTRPLMAIAGGVSPDVIYVNFRQSDTYIREGFLYPLDKWVEPLQKDHPDEFAERVPAQVLKVIRRWGPGEEERQGPRQALLGEALRHLHQGTDVAERRLQGGRA